MTEDVSFFQARPGGRVHVFDRYDIPAIYEETVPGIAESPVGAILRRPYARCGAEGASFTSDEGFVDEFHDDNLCLACRRTVVNAESDRLFAHALPRGETT